MTDDGVADGVADDSRDRRLDDVISVIARQAKASNLTRTEDVGSVLEELPDAPPERVDQALRSAHQLAGSAGTFGQLRASQLARRLEEFLIDSPSTQDPQRIQQARHDLVELRQTLEDS